MFEVRGAEGRGPHGAGTKASTWQGAAITASAALSSREKPRAHWPRARLRGPIMSGGGRAAQWERGGRWRLVYACASGPSAPPLARAPIALPAAPGLVRVTLVPGRPASAVRACGPGAGSRAGPVGRGPAGPPCAPRPCRDPGPPRQAPAAPRARHTRSPAPEVAALGLAAEPPLLRGNDALLPRGGGIDEPGPRARRAASGCGALEGRPFIQDKGAPAAPRGGRVVGGSPPL
ncbi:cuticle collagen 2C-like [Choloepus didactylus]|uniref:cuticle collagen 2C-like n=1 Tax=Choloepus didactylus TaxID=27675 RepID=UPI00189DD9CD|nr:cuticle collagen 2C-like [Choloepus didactylus]